MFTFDVVLADRSKVDRSAPVGCKFTAMEKGSTADGKAMSLSSCLAVRMAEARAHKAAAGDSTTGRQPREDVPRHRVTSSQDALHVQFVNPAGRSAPVE